RSASPTSASKRVARCRCSDVTPVGRNGTRTFSRAVKLPIRLNDWKTKPTFSRQYLFCADSDDFARSWPSTSTAPDVGRSRAPIKYKSVFLPEPLGPRDRRLRLLPQT